MTELQHRPDTFVIDKKYLKQEAITGLRTFFAPITGLVTIYRMAMTPTAKLEKIRVAKLTDSALGKSKRVKRHVPRKKRPIKRRTSAG